MDEEILCQLRGVERAASANLPGTQSAGSEYEPACRVVFRLPVLSAERVCGSQVHARDFTRDVGSHSNCSCLGCVLGRSAKRLWDFRFLERLHRRSIRGVNAGRRSWRALVRKCGRPLSRSRSLDYSSISPVRPQTLTVSLVFLLCLLALPVSSFAHQLGSSQGIESASSSNFVFSGVTLPKDARTVIVDGNTYPYTSAGLQAAINLASAGATGGNSADVFLMPHANFALGSTGISIPTNVCVIALGDPNSEAITYNGAGAAVTFDATAGNVAHSCLRGVSIFLGPSAGPSAAAILIKSTFGTGQASSNELSNLIISNSAVNSTNQNQVGILIWDTTGAPAGVSSTRFTNILFGNINEPVIGNTANASCTAFVTPWLCCTGSTTGTCGATGEANQWTNIMLTGQNWDNQFQMNDADSFFQVSSSAQPQNCSAGSPCVSFSEAGRMNQIQLKTDNGSTTSFKSINDTGSYNIWKLSALTPIGTIAATSQLTSIPSATVGTAGASEQMGIVLNNKVGYQVNGTRGFGDTEGYYSVAGTPIPACAAGIAHTFACVSDASACTSGTTYTGSSATKCLLQCNDAGTLWKETGINCF